MFPYNLSIYIVNKSYYQILPPADHIQVPVSIHFRHLPKQQERLELCQCQQSFADLIFGGEETNENSPDVA